jgi:hypothetical protein
VANLLANSGYRQPRIFLSHSHSDKEIVRKTAEGLRKAGIDVWLDEAELNLGDSLVAKIERGLDSADYVAFFLSNASLRSRWARQELNVAISRQVSGNRGAVILPILLENAEIPSLLKDLMYLDLRDGDVDAGVRKLVSAISRLQIERMQTYNARVNRYFNPPDQIRRIGRPLQGIDFVGLVSELLGDEVLVGLYRNQVGTSIATHLHSRARMNEMEGLWAPAEGYYAVRRRDANAGFDNKIPEDL